MSTSPEELTLQLSDFRLRVLEADKLRRLGDTEKAEALMPSRDEVIQAIKAYRQAISQKAPKRSASAEKKTEAQKLRTMNDLKKLFQ